MKTLKFTQDLAEKILSGEKTSTWRMFDDKDLQIGDELSLVSYDTQKEFAEAVIVEIRETELGSVREEDYEGHARYDSNDQMLEEYKGYYGDKVTLESIVKIIKFKLNEK